jgi:hypothetical protein
MTLPHTIPYNPRLKPIALFFGIAVLTLAVGAMSLFPVRIALFLSAVFLSFASLLLLHRMVWPRQLALSGDSITVPSGFLRLRSAEIQYEQIMRVWVHRVLVTSVICVKTANRKVEIQDFYLPDAATFDSRCDWASSSGKTLG